MSKIGSQAEFARQYGYSKAAVSQFKNEGRIVFASPGRVDFEATKKRIFDTSDPRRNDVSDRHAQKRAITNDNSGASAGSFQNARTVREKYLALQAKLDYEVNSGLLVEKSVVDKIVFERARQMRDGMMVCSRRIAPEIAGKTDITEIEGVIAREFRALLESFSKLPVIE